MTGHDLCIRCGLSPRLVDEFVRPFLLVCLFKPLEELSALVVLELIYFFAAAHHDSFDVRWIKRGSVSSTFVAPLAAKLQREHALQILGGSKVASIALRPDRKHALTYRRNGAERVLEDVDGVVLALGCGGIRPVVAASPDLARIPTFSRAASLPGIDVMSVRLWLDRTVSTRSPSNVLANFDALRGAGGTFFMLDQLQGNGPHLWGDDDPGEGGRGSVVACDFYNAGALLSLPDADIVDMLLGDMLPRAESGFAAARVVDAWVGRYPGAVSWFSPGSYPNRPPLGGAPSLPSVVFAGDWVRMGEREPPAKGLCQERAYVSGIEAGNLLLERLLPEQCRGGRVKLHQVLQGRGEEDLFKTGKKASRAIMSFLPRFWVR